MAVLVRRHDGGRSQQRYQPVQRYRELEDIQQQTAQLLEQMMGVPADVVRPWVPDVDIEETEDAWILEAELPGARAEDVKVEVDDGELTIRGAIVERERAGILRRRTRRVGEFEYQVSLPGLRDDVEPKARLHHGVLEVRVPKPEQARPRQVQIREDAESSSGDAGGSGGSGTGRSGS
ncbi:MAG: heat-shock protein [Conexibacter sp.]|nr:heat-shock protein [Conexibacter sp.]